MESSIIKIKWNKKLKAMISKEASKFPSVSITKLMSLKQICRIFILDGRWNQHKFRLGLRKTTN